jgi:hypothetical protein
LGLVPALAPAGADAAGVTVRFDASDPAGRPFPSDSFTLPDWSNATFRRINLPKPECAARPNDCDDVDLLNTLDGFSTQPRITVPFSGDIDPSSVSSDTIFLLNLGDVLTLRGFGQRVGINQVVWDVGLRTLAFESDELLEPRSRYLLVITDGVRDAAGNRIKPPSLSSVSAALHDLREAARHHRGTNRVVAASLFTTQSITGDLKKVRERIKQSTPAEVNFLIGPGGSRAVFAVGSNSLSGVQFVRHTGTALDGTPTFAAPAALNPVLLGSVAQLAYGRYRSPDYQLEPAWIPPTPTLTGEPQLQRTNELLFQLMVPAGARPAGGWPVAIHGHGNPGTIHSFGVWRIAGELAAQGVATIAIHSVGNGGGALGTVNVLQAGQPPSVLNAGGRSTDLNGDGVIGANEGTRAAAPRGLLGNRDAVRQTAIDQLQLVRQIEAGIDVDGDGVTDLDANRVYVIGQSFGAHHGTMLLALEPRVVAGAMNVAGGSAIEAIRLGAVRFALGFGLAARVPSLINIGGEVFDEAMPLRDQPPLTNAVPGAFAIAEVIDREEWLWQGANPVAWAPYIRKQPLPGSAPKPVLFQFAKGDQLHPNPTNSAWLRAGELADRATFYRHDLAYALDPTLPKDPHAFLTSVNPALLPIGLQAVQQIAVFLGTNGTITIDPDGAGTLFEVPVALPLPETTSFIP